MNTDIKVHTTFCIHKMAQSTHITRDAMAIKVPVLSKHLCTIEPAFQGRLYDQKEIRVMCLYNEEMDDGVDLKLQKRFFIQFLCIFNPDDFANGTKDSINYYVLKYITNKSSIVSMKTHFSAVLKNPRRISIQPTLHDALRLESLGVFNTWPMFRV